MSAAATPARRPPAGGQPAPAGARAAPRGAGAAYAAALVSTLGWASLYPVAKPALDEVTPLMIAGARAGIACLALSALVCARSGGVAAGARRLRREAAANTGGILALGLISFAGTSLLAMTAQQFLPASINTLLNNLSPLWLSFYATLAGRARHGPLLLAGSALAAAGVALVLLGDAALSALNAARLALHASRPAALAGAAGLGVALSLCGSLLIAVSNLVTRRVMGGRDALAVTAVAAGWGALPLLALLLVGVGGSLPAYGAASPGTQARLLWLGTCSTAFNFSLWFFALSRVPVTRVANFQYLIPPLGVGLAVLLLGEPLGPGLLAGTVAIVSGIALAQRGAEPPAPLTPNPSPLVGEAAGG